MPDMLDLHAPELWSHLEQILREAEAGDVDRALGARPGDLRALAVLLGPTARHRLEDLACRARGLTAQRFGRVVVMYVPLYLSNACVNHCRYCGFAADRQTPRRTLSVGEVEQEIQQLRGAGYDHVLLLTGEHPREVPLSHILDRVEQAHRHFDSVGVEIYPLDEAGYRQLAARGVDSLTLYQETYHRPTYARMHPAGPKRHVDARLEAPLHAARAGLRSVNIGALLGLADWRVEALAMALHGLAIKRLGWRSKLGFGFPRIHDADPSLELCPVDEGDLVQMICALRCCFPDAELVLSTRERAAFRDGMVGLGVTRMSAGSSTRPGGYAGGDAAGEQFATHDGRDLLQVVASIEARGYEAVLKDFDQEFLP